MADIDHQAESYVALNMPTRQLEKRCARAAAKAGKFLASARAKVESELAYFLELRHRLSAPGQRGVEGWQKWVEKHFSCDVRTVNRALSAILGPEKERKKPESRKGRKEVVEAFIHATAPAMRLARKYPKDEDANELLESLEAGELAGMVPEPQPRPESLIDKMRQYKRAKTEELYKMGLNLAHAVADGASSVRSDTDDGKRILGLAKSIIAMEAKAEKPQDNLSQSPGGNFVVDDPDDPDEETVVESKKTPTMWAFLNDAPEPEKRSPKAVQIKNGLILRIGKNMACNVANLPDFEVIEVLSHGVRLSHKVPPVIENGSWKNMSEITNGVWELTLRVRGWREDTMEPFTEPKPLRKNSG